MRARWAMARERLHALSQTAISCPATCERKSLSLTLSDLNGHLNPKTGPMNAFWLQMKTENRHSVHTMGPPSVVSLMNMTLHPKLRVRFAPLCYNAS